MSTAISTRLRAIAMPTAFAERIRAEMKDEFGNRLTAERAEGPCRHCLRYATPGEELILFSYRPFPGPGLYQEIGPVFIHAESCPRYSEEAFPPAFAQRPLILRPYASDDTIEDSQVIAEAGRAPEIAAKLLEDPRVAYVHVRSFYRGCYLFRIER